MPDTILIIHFGDNGIRGTEVCLIQSAKAFTVNDFQVVICRNHPAMDPLLNELSEKPLLIDMQFPEIMIAGKSETSLPIVSYFQSLNQLNKIVKKYKPLLIYCNSGLPCQLAVPIGRLHHIPVLCHFHHPAIKRAYYFWLVVLADKIVFPSKFTKLHSEMKAGVTGDVVHNGVDLRRFRPNVIPNPHYRSKLGIDKDAIVIGQVAQLVAHKRPDFLIRAFSSLLRQCERPIHLCLVGKGPLKAVLRDLVRSLRIESYVSITGVVDDVLPYYQHVFDINVLVSKMEGLGISAIEGSACGLPIVVAKCTGLTETVLEGQTGLSFEVDDIDDLCKKLLSLINNPSLRNEMGTAGRAYVEHNFSAEAYNNGLVTIANQLLGRGSEFKVAGHSTI